VAPGLLSNRDYLSVRADIATHLLQRTSLIMSEHNSDAFSLTNARVPLFQWISVVGMIVSIAFALSSRLTANDRTAVDLSKLQNDVTEMRKQMALREDVSDLTKQMRDLEIEVAKLSDRLERK
jgi:uncharacterized protein YlxW (UPF0749 family)